jgi:hypothetical protein
MYLTELNNNMSFESNNGSVYYELSCGVPTVSGWSPENNNGTKYYYLSTNDFILWGQGDTYVHPLSNNGTTYYFYECSRPTDSGWSPLSNNDTKFYYNSAFNCVMFCE